MPYRVIAALRTCLLLEFFFYCSLLCAFASSRLISVIVLLGSCVFLWVPFFYSSHLSTLSWSSSSNKAEFSFDLNFDRKRK